MFLLFHETFPLAWNITGVFPRRVGLSVIESIVMPLVITDGTVRWNRNRFGCDSYKICTFVI